MLRDAHKEARKAVATDVLHSYSTVGEGFLLQHVTRDETWIFHFELNPNSSGWNGTT
jgi:hypothetical protein